MMLARMRFRSCPLTLRKPVCCGFCAHCGHAGLPCASMVIGVRREHQRPTASAHTNTAMPKRFIGFVLLLDDLSEAGNCPQRRGWGAISSSDPAGEAMFIRNFRFELPLRPKA